MEFRRFSIMFHILIPSLSLYRMLSNIVDYHFSLNISYPVLLTIYPSI